MAIVNSLGLSSSDSGGSVGQRGPRGVSLASLTFVNNNDGSVTITPTMTDGTSLSPSTVSMTSDNLVANSLLLSRTNSSTKLLIKTNDNNPILTVDTNGSVITMNGIVQATNFFTYVKANVGIPVQLLISNTDTSITSSAQLGMNAGNGLGGSKTGTITYNTQAFTFSDPISSLQTGLAINSILQTDGSGTMIASNSLPTPPYISGSVGVSGNHNFDIGGASNALRNIYTTQVILTPNDVSVGVIRSHQAFVGLAIETATCMGTGGSLGLCVDANNNAQILGDTFYKSSGISFSNPSDRTLKENIKDFTTGLEVVSQIRVRSFNLIDDNKKKPLVGIIAQELQEVYPKAIFQGANGKLHFDSNDLIFMLINSVQDLKKIVDIQTKEILALKFISSSVNRKK